MVSFPARIVNSFKPYNDAERAYIQERTNSILHSVDALIENAKKGKLPVSTSRVPAREQVNALLDVLTRGQGFFDKNRSKELIAKIAELNAIQFPEGASFGRKLANGAKQIPTALLQGAVSAGRFAWNHAAVLGLTTLGTAATVAHAVLPFCSELKEIPLEIPVITPVVTNSGFFQNVVSLLWTNNRVQENIIAFTGPIFGNLTKIEPVLGLPCEALGTCELQSISGPVCNAAKTIINSPYFTAETALAVGAVVGTVYLAKKAAQLFLATPQPK